MSRRGRALAFALLAAACGIASASIAASYRERVDGRLGETRSVLMLTRTLAPGAKLTAATLGRSAELREIPVRFLPPDAIATAREVAGRRLAAAVPAGSYLLGSQLRTARSVQAPPRLSDRLHPVEVTVSAAGALAGSAPGERVDVVVAGDPVVGARARVRLAARNVRLLAIAPADPADETVAGSGGWSATLALTRSQALELIEAENFAREIRLIPAS